MLKFKYIFLLHGNNVSVKSLQLSECFSCQGMVQSNTVDLTSNLKFRTENEQTYIHDPSGFTRNIVYHFDWFI